MFNTLIDMIDSNQSEEIGVTHILGGKEEKFVSYCALYEKALQILDSLQRNNVQAGDKIILQIDDQEKYLYGLWACILGGIIPVPLSVGFTDEQISRVFRVYSLFERSYLLATEDVLVMIDRFASKDPTLTINKEHILLFSSMESTSEKGKIHTAAPDDVALIMFSSGSTGEPKGVKTTHKNILTTNEDLVIKFDADSQDVSLHWMPLTHMVGLVFCHLYPLMTSTPQYLMDKKLFFRDPKIWLDKICEHKATVLLTANFGMKYLMSKVEPSQRYEWNLSHIKIITLGGEALSVSLMDAFVHFFAPYGMTKRMMSPVYGVTEAMVVACVCAKDEINPYYLDRMHMSIGSYIKESPDDGISFVGLGEPPKRCLVRICNDQDVVLRDSFVGHIQASGPNVTPGYYSTSGTPGEEFTPDGWYRTGDVGFMQKGEVVITGRAKEMIIVNMVNYYLFDVERVMESTDCTLAGNIAVIGMQNPDTMEDDIIAFVKYEGNIESFFALAKTIRQTVKTKLGLSIKNLIPVDELPRTGLGKVSRGILKRMFVSGKFNSIIGDLDALCTGDANAKKKIELEIKEKLFSIVHTVIGVDNINMSDNIFDLGAESLTAVQLSVEIEDKFNIVLTLRNLYEEPTIENIYKKILLLSSLQ